ncbi:hypothetical protein Tco_0365267 [Tanacetum coccineum]
MNHQTSSVSKIAYQSPQVTTQLMTELPLVDLSFVVHVFSLGDLPIACLNKAMAFLKMAESQCNKFRGDKGKVILVLGEGHMARQCTQPKRPRNAAWYKEKAMLAEAQEARKILDEEQLTFLADLGLRDSQAVQIIIPNNAAFQTEDLNTYDSDYNEIHSDSNIIPYSQYLKETQQAKVQDTHLQAQQDLMILSVIEQMLKQMINHVNNWEKANKEQNNESVTAELERYKE